MANPMPIQEHRRSSRPARLARGGGFTLTELLVVVAIVVLLLGTLLVAVSAAAKRSQIANTQTLMNSIATGLGQFQADFGYLPPVLGVRDTGAPVRGRGRDVINFSQHAVGPNLVAKQQTWASDTTLAEFLLGYGHRGEDGYGQFPTVPVVVNDPPQPGDREKPPFGIRSPGPDGAFGSIDSPQPAFAANPAFRGYYRARNPARLAAPPQLVSNVWNTAQVEGKVYGPYIDLKDERLIAGINGYQANGQPNLVFASDATTNPTTRFDELPKTIVDYWGQPITYFRTPYTNDDLRSSVAKADGSFANLGDIYMLRPWEISPSDRSAGELDAGGDDGSNAMLKGASFAIFSRGPDRSFDRTRRRDTEEFNKDNIVVTGK